MGVPSGDPFSEDYDVALTQEPVVTGMCELCSDLLWGKHIGGILEALGGREVLVLTIHGSHLYGLNHADSDVDVKGVYLPTMEEILLNKIPKRPIKYNSCGSGQKNTKDDIDVELYSLHHFFTLLKQGDTGAISLLFTPSNQVCSHHGLWNSVVENRNLFLSKKMAGLIGFVKRQTDKYCIKGERLASANLMFELLKGLPDDTKVRDIWDKIPFSKHVRMVMIEDQRFLEICGRKIQDTNYVEYGNKIIISIINSYGKRAKEAELNSGVDWKAVSHAFRVASELTDLYSSGMIHYPLLDFEIIKRIKMGELDFDTQVLPNLNSLMDRVHEMSQKSDFPDQVDDGKIDSLLLSLVKSTMEVHNEY